RSFRLTPVIIENTLAILKDKVWPVAQEEGLTKTQLALSYILSFPEISTIIPGIRTPEHVVQNTEGLKPLTKDHVAFLHSLSEKDWKPVIEMMEKQG
ncbi:MAG: aldo/keto reductase, partial [Flavisolibacter sp.]